MNNMASNKEFPQFTENIAERPGSACNGGTADGWILATLMKTTSSTLSQGLVMLIRFLMPNTDLNEA